MKRLAILAVAVIALSGCVSAGIATQQQSEQEYSVAATGAYAFLTSAQPSAKAVNATCSADNAAYLILTSTRTPVDGANYTAADNIHSTLQATCAKLQS